MARACTKNKKNNVQRERVTLHKLMSVLADVCYRVLEACLVREDGLALLGLR